MEHQKIQEKNIEKQEEASLSEGKVLEMVKISEIVMAFFVLRI